MDCDPNLKEDFFFSTAFSNNFSNKPKMGNEFYSSIKSVCPSNNNRPLPFQDMHPHFGSQFTLGEGSSSNPSVGIPNRSFDLFKPPSFEFLKESNPYPSGGFGSVPRANDEGLLHACQNDRLFKQGSVIFPIEKNRILGDDDHHHQNRTLKFKEFEGGSVNNTNKVSFGITAQNGRASRDRSSSHAIKGQWTSEEDEMLLQLVKKHGDKKWAIVAERMQARVGKQCRERWLNHLRPGIKTSPWTEEEDMILIQLHSKLGNGWSEMAKRLPGRTENSIKNHWNATKRRQLSKRRTKTLSQSSVQLQEYIQSVIVGEKKITTSAGRSGGAGNETAEFYPNYDNASNDYDDEDEDDEADAMDGDGGFVPGHGRGHGHGGVVPGDDDGHDHGGVVPCDGHGGGVSGPGDGGADIFVDCYKVAPPADAMDGDGGFVPGHGRGHGHGHGGVVPGDDDGHDHGGVVPCDGHGGGVSGPGDGGADIFADCYKVAPPVVDHHYRDMPYYGGGCGYGGGDGGGSSVGEMFYEIPYHYTDFDMMMGLGGCGGLMNKEMDFLNMFPQKKS